MEVATEGIYFIIYVTYIIVTTTCFALSSVLFLTKGIKTPLSNNKSYIKGKNLIATGILMEGFVHFLMFITIVLGYKYQNMYEFVIPTIFFVQVIIIYAGLQTFMYSKVNVSYRLGVYMSLPIVAIATSITPYSSSLTFMPSSTTALTWLLTMPILSVLRRGCSTLCLPPT